MNKILCLLICTLFLTGCASHGTEEQMMVVLLGIDKTDQGGVKAIAKVPAFSGGGDSSSGSESDGYLTFSASGDTLPSALNLLYATAPRNLNYSQTRQILIQQDALLAYPDIIHMLGRIEGMRSQTIVSVCKEQAEDVISAEKAVIGTRLSRYIDTTLETGVREGYIPDSTLIRVLTRMGGGYRDALLTLSGLSGKDQKEQEEQSAKQAVSQSTDGLAGDMPHTSGRAVQWIGAAALDGDRLTGFLTGFETMLCRFLNQEIGVLPFETEDGVISCTARYGPHLSIQNKNNACILVIRADLNVLPKYGASIDLEETDLQITRTIAQLLHTLQSLRCDALGFGGIAARDHLTLTSWEHSNWKNTFVSADTYIDIRLIQVDE